MHRTAKELSLEELHQYHSVLPQETGTELQNLRGFRHVFIYIYADALDYEQVLENAERVSTVFPKIAAELDIFITWLEQHV